MKKSIKKDEAGAKVQGIIEGIDSKNGQLRIASSDREAMPELPTSARIAEPPPNRFPWLRDYMKFSRKWSPRSTDGMHEAVALWVLSTAAAGRVRFFEQGEPERAALYYLIVAGTSAWAKSTCAKVGTRLLDKADLSHLLLDSGTPQAQIESMRLRVPPDYHTMLPHERDEVRKGLAFAAQRGWFADEFGGDLAIMQNKNSHMYALAKMLLKFHDSDDSVTDSTIGRGRLRLLRPTLSVLGVSTFAQLSDAIKKNEKLWEDGTFARFCLVTPQPSEPERNNQAPNENRVYPDSLIQPLRKMHAALGTNEVVIESHEIPAEAKNGKPTLTYGATVRRWAEYNVGLSDGFVEAATKYDAALFTLRQDMGSWCNGSYVRFPNTARRIAVLLAAIEGASVADVDHWAKAQAIVERSRQQLHWAKSAFQSAYGDVPDIDRICELLEARGALTLREIQRKLHREPFAKDAKALKMKLDVMVSEGLIFHGGTPKRPLYSRFAEELPANVLAITGS